MFFIFLNIIKLIRYFSVNEVQQYCMDYEVEKIVGRRNDGVRNVILYLVKWKDCDEWVNRMIVLVFL